MRLRLRRADPPLFVRTTDSRAPPGPPVSTMLRGPERQPRDRVCRLATRQDRDNAARLPLLAVAPVSPGTEPPPHQVDPRQDARAPLSVPSPPNLIGPSGRDTANPKGIAAR